MASRKPINSLQQMTEVDKHAAWSAFVGLVRRRIRMYTLTGGLAEVAALFVGFDNGIGPGILGAFQEWMSARHDGHSEFVFLVLVVHELTGDHESWTFPLPSKVDADAALLLLDLLDQFLQEQPTS